MKKKSLMSQLKELCVADTVGKRRDGSIILRKGFFYRHGCTAEMYGQGVLTACERIGVKVQLLEVGEHYAAFRGGASVANSSHWYVVIKEAEECSQEKA